VNFDIWKKMKICVKRIFSGMNSPSARLKSVGGQAGEFIRYTIEKYKERIK